MPRFVRICAALIALCFAATVQSCGQNSDATRPEAQKENEKRELSPGAMYEAGKEAARNYAEALKWAHSAKQDIEQTQSDIDARYAEVAGVDQDDKKFANQPRLASKQENTKNQYRHEEAPAASGNIDYEKFVQQDRLAAQQGSAQAQYNLGVAYEYGLGVPQNENEAMKWYQLAAKQGFLKARYRYEEILRKTR